MCISWSRYRSSLSRGLRFAALLLALCPVPGPSYPEIARAEQAAPLTPVVSPETVEGFQSWLNGDDPLLVLFVVDGLRTDRVSKADWRGEPLMPCLHALTNQALEYRNCFSECTVSGSDLFCLLAGLSPFEYLQQAQVDSVPLESGFGALVAAGFEAFAITPSGGLIYHDGLVRLPWLQQTSRQEQGPVRDISPELLKTEFAAHADSVLIRLTTSTRPTLLLVFTDALVPPYLECKDFLTRTDPAPWVGGKAKTTMEVQRDKRMKQAQNRGNVLRLSWRANHPLEANWLLDAAHAATDSLLGCLVDRLERENLWSRTCLVVTSLRGMATGRREDYGPTGVGLDQVWTPLIIRLPDGIGEARGVDAPVVLSDLGATFAQHLRQNRTATGGRIDLLGTIPAERNRWSLAWSENNGKFLAADWGGIRLTTSDFTFLDMADGSHRLFDPRLDPEEFEDLAPGEAAALEEVQRLVHDELYGEEQEIWIYFKGSAENELLTGSVTALSPLKEWEAIGLENDDAVILDNTSLNLSLVLEESGDLLRLRIRDFDPGLRMKLEAHGERGLWPVFVGKSAMVFDGTAFALSRHQERLLRAIVRDPGAGIIEWARNRGDGIYLWVVPQHR